MTLPRPGGGAPTPPKSPTPEGGTTLWSPSHPGGWPVTPSSHKDPLFCRACAPAPERSAPQEPLQGPSAGALRAPGPRASTSGFVRPATWGTWGAEGRAGRHGAPGEAARKGTPSWSPSLAGIEGSGLREETSPEPRRGELKERRGGGEHGGGKNRSWSSGGAGAASCGPRPPHLPHLAHHPSSTPPGGSLTPPLSLAVSVSGRGSALLSFPPS